MGYVPSGIRGGYSSPQKKTFADLQVPYFHSLEKLSPCHVGMFKRSRSFLTMTNFSVPAIYRRSKRISNKIPFSREEDWGMFFRRSCKFCWSWEGVSLF